MKKKHVYRYFFTGTKETAEWLEREAKSAGLTVPKYLRSILHKIATNKDK